MVEVMVESPNDKELILQFQNGNRNAFDKLYGRYGDILYSLIVYQIGNHAADDLFQDIVINVQKYLVKFNPDGNFRAWLIKIAINKIHDFRRKENRMKKLFKFNSNHHPDGEDQNDMARFEFTEAADASLKYIENETSTILHAAIQKLPEKQREVVNLHYVIGLTFKEIAEVLECSINTISARARYGLINIRKILGVKLVNELK
jgi:RNA polymerase sigma-70 factor (ECF subfamily)